MASPTSAHRRLDAATPLAADFTARLQASLRDAEHERKRHLLIRRLQRVLPLIFLVGPIVAWRLMSISPGGTRAGIEALAGITFVLDVGVHLDTVLLSYLGLQILPSVVGVLLLVFITAGLLLSSDPDA